MSSQSASEVEQHIAKLTAEDLEEILKLTVKVERSSDVSTRIEKFSAQKENGDKVDVCSYQCTTQGCNFDELLSWISKYQNSVVTEMMDDEMKNSSAKAVCAQVNKHMNTIKPRDYDGYFFHHHNRPILFMKNAEVAHPIYTQLRSDVASIDVENLAFYTMKTMKKGAMSEYMRKLNITSTWEELAINAGAAVLGISSVVLAMKKKPFSSVPPLISPLLLGGLSVGMFAINRYGQQQKSQKKQ
jgi:hypothetical protein